MPVLYLAVAIQYILPHCVCPYQPALFASACRPTDTFPSDALVNNPTMPVPRFCSVAIWQTSI